MCVCSRRAVAFCAAHRKCRFLQGPERAEPHRPVARYHHAAAPTFVDVRPHRLPRLRCKRSAALANAHAQASASSGPLHGVRSRRCCRNVARNSLTGRFPAFFSSMPSIANLYVAHARSVCVRRRLALMAARQVVWRESSHRDASRQHHADADIAAVVRRCPFSSAAACVLGSIAHVRRNVTFNWLVGDVSEIARMNGTAYPLPCLI